MTSLGFVVKAAGLRMVCEALPGLPYLLHIPCSSHLLLFSLTHWFQLLVADCDFNRSSILCPRPRVFSLWSGLSEACSKAPSQTVLWRHRHPGEASDLLPYSASFSSLELLSSNITTYFLLSLCLYLVDQMLVNACGMLS